MAEHLYRPMRMDAPYNHPQGIAWPSVEDTLRDRIYALEMRIWELESQLATRPTEGERD